MIVKSDTVASASLYSLWLRNLNVMDLNDVYDKIMAGEDVIVRISGYCVNTKYLTPEQKTELTQRVFHEVLSMDDALS